MFVPVSWFKCALFFTLPAQLTDTCTRACMHAVGTQVPGTSASDPSNTKECVMGGIYWQLLSSFQELFRARPAAIRLCLLAHVLDAWQPNYRCGCRSGIHLSD